MPKTIEQLEAENAELAKSLTSLNTTVQQLAADRAAEKTAAEKAALDKAAADKLAAEKKDDKKDDKKGTGDHELSTRVSELEATAKRQQKNEAMRLIQAGLTAQQVDADVAKKMYAPSIYAEIESRLAFDQDLNVTVKTPDGSKSEPLAAFVGAYLQTDLGKKILPNKTNPSPGDLTGGHGVHVQPGAKVVNQAGLLNGGVDIMDVRKGTLKVEL